MAINAGTETMRAILIGVERAAQASQAWKHPYNQACALARGKLKGSEQALAEAIERGGARVRKKANTDEDLKNVRGEAWFAKLVTG